MHRRTTQRTNYQGGFSSIKVAIELVWKMDHCQTYYDALDKIAVQNLGSENVVILSNSLSRRVKDVFAL